MTIESTFVHIIIAPTTWDNDPIQYRRHRLADFLRKLPETKQVVWIAPEVTGHIQSISKQPHVEELRNGIHQIKVPDYKSLVRHTDVLQRHLKSVVSSLLYEQ
jgi:teichuronic acid biosynthesis glycosyltransferase TuaH